MLILATIDQDRIKVIGGNGEQCLILSLRRFNACGSKYAAKGFGKHVGVWADNQQAFGAFAGLTVDIFATLDNFFLADGVHAAPAFAGAGFLPWPRVSHDVVAKVANAKGVIVM